MSGLDVTRERGQAPDAEGPSIEAGLLDAIDLGAFHADAGGVIRTWNRAAAELTGFSAAEIVGQPLSVLHPAHDGELAAEEVAEARRAGRSERSGWRVQKGGKRFWAQSIITSLGPAGFAVALSRRRFGFLDQVSSLLAVTLDPAHALENLCRLAVPYLADFCAVDLVEQGRPLRRAAFAHVDGACEALLSARRDGSTQIAPAPARVLRTSRSELIAELDGHRLPELASSDEERIALEKLAPGSLLLLPLSARGHVLGVLTLAAGPDRRYVAEDQAMAEELCRRAGIALDNARLHQEAREAVRARDEFLSVASHEIKTPLTTVQIHVQMLLRAVRRGAVDPDMLERKLASTEEQVRRLGALMDELLDASRITAGKLELDRRSLRLDELVRQVAARYEDELALAGIELSLELAPVEGSWDGNRLEQVLVNLISNAIKYASGRPLDVTLSAVHGRAVLAVRDRGPGIAAEDQARIFDRFQRADDRSLSGLGLGLFIARQIVAAHRGTIQVVSEAGAGATFIVVLPTSPQDR